MRSLQLPTLLIVLKSQQFFCGEKVGMMLYLSNSPFKFIPFDTY